VALMLWLLGSLYVYGFCSPEGRNGQFLAADTAKSNADPRSEHSVLGGLLRATGPAAKANPFRFSTKYQDNETDLLYYGYRYYNASTGTWISRDPLEERAANNLYGFVNNAPISLIDRLGQRVPCNTRALAGCLARCLAWAGSYYVGVHCDMERNLWTLGLCWRVYCTCITRCDLKQQIPLGPVTICIYNCPMRNPAGNPANYIPLVVPTVEGCPKTITDDR
jgi:RHS repeat-associated protein